MREGGLQENQFTGVKLGVHVCKEGYLKRGRHDDPGAQGAYENHKLLNANIVGLGRVWWFD